MQERLWAEQVESVGSGMLTASLERVQNGIPDLSGLELAPNP